MKKSSKVKYFGVAAAALLAVAPVVAPAFTAANNEPATVQAAVTGTPATIAANQTVDAGAQVFAYISSAYNNGVLTGVKLDNGAKFTNNSKVQNIDGVNYFVGNGQITYNGLDGNPKTTTQDFYVPVDSVLTLGYAVNQYFQGTVDPAAVTEDGKTPAPAKAADEIAGEFKDGTAYVTAVYTGTTQTTTTTPGFVTNEVEAKDATVKVKAGIGATFTDGVYTAKSVDGSEDVEIAASNINTTYVTGEDKTPVYKLTDGTFNTAADGSGDAVAKDDVTTVYTVAANVLNDDAVAAVKAGTVVTKNADGTFVTADGVKVDAENVNAVDVPTTTTNTAQYYAVQYKGKTYFVPSAGLTLSGAVVKSDVTGTITTVKDDVRTFSDAAVQNYTGNLIRTKGTQLLVDQKSTVNGEVVAYHVVDDADTAAGTWVPAKFVNFNDSVLVASAAKGTVTANADNTNLYTNKATTTLSGDKLAEGQDVNYTRVVKNSVTGEIVAYGYLNTNQGDSSYNSYVYVKASDVTVNAAADVDTAKLPAGTAVYSNNKAATIYTDAAATKDSGVKLSTDVNEWSAFETSTDADGNIVAYRLGKNQWVKAADLELQQDLDGTFDVAAGTTLYSVDGDKTGTIENGGSYKVFAVRYINGKQSLKLGTDNQWVVASQGDFYPA